LLDKYEHILSKHRLENPDLYRIVEEKKILQLKKITEAKVTTPSTLTSETKSKVSKPKDSLESIYFKQYSQKELKSKLSENQKIIHEHIVTTQSKIISRTQARNAKQNDSIETITSERADKLEAQIKAWRSLLPVLIRRF
jgi:hypothetical protein